MRQEAGTPWRSDGAQGARAQRSPQMTQAGPQERRRSVAVDVGGVLVGGGAPVVVQSMTNTDTADIEGTVRQVAALARAGSEIVRITVDRDEAAAAVPHIKERLLKMDRNAASPAPRDVRWVTREAMIQSALLSAGRAEEIGLPRDRIILSAKVSAVQDLIAVYAELARRSDYAIHLGLTEAGMGSKGIVASAAALSVLLQQGVGDTIRISLTPEPGGDRTLEVKVAQEILQTMGFRVFVPLVAACPGCGRTTSTTFQELARDIQSFIHESMPAWKRQYPGVETLNVAVMGCIVNGPGESKHADIGISLPGTGEQPAAPVFIDGKKAVTLRGATVAADFKQMVIDYIERRFGHGGAGRTAAE